MRELSKGKVNLSLRLINKASRRKDVLWSGGIAPLFLISAALLPRKDRRYPLIHWTRGWLVPKAGLEAVGYSKNSCSCRESNPAVQCVARRFNERTR
jgi:hypothetical protein